jgi:hypothetical protein
VIALRKEEAGVLVMELSEHLWPEDLDLAISMVHNVASFPTESAFITC